MPQTLLVVDDDPNIRSSLELYFRRQGFEVHNAPSGQEALEVVKDCIPAVAIIDLHLPDMSGIELIRRIKTLQPETPVVMITAYGDIDIAVQAMKEGADHFVSKPMELEDLNRIIRNLLETYQAKDRVNYLKVRLLRLEVHGQLEEIRLPAETRTAIKMLAESDNTSVLILGETGTGKSLVANLIHSLGPRQHAQLVDINCAGLSDQLLESELFGHEQGAFTDARATKKGLLEIAHAGTAFFDEISELSPAVQAKLLKVMETQTFRRVGGTQTIKVDVRIIAATNQDLAAMVKERKFREDLYYRLNIVPLRLPPLRERKEDIMPLADQFLKEFNLKFKKNISRVCPEAEEMMMSYHWPGNVRELKNVLERAALICEDQVIPEVILPKRMAEPSPAINGNGHFPTLEEMEGRYIRVALAAANNNRSQAARALGIHRHTLLDKIKKYGIEL